MSYTASFIQTADAQVSGTADLRATAAAQMSALLWARAMSAATIGPETPLTRLITPAVLYEIGRQFVLQGQSVWMVHADGVNRPRIVQACDWDVFGILDWRYRVTLSGPDGTVVRRAPAAGVIHARINTDPAEPHRGRSPLDLPRTSGRLLANLETSLSREAGGLVGYVLPAPTEGLSDEDTEDLENDIKGLAGGVALVPSMRRGFGEGAAGQPAGSDWRALRIGPNPPESEVALRNDAARSILSTCGVPPVLVGGIAGDSAAQREAWRQFLHGTIQPVADVLSVELSDKLETDVTISFDRLFASDVQGRARAVQSMANAGMDIQDARRLTGLD